MNELLLIKYICVECYFSRDGLHELRISELLTIQAQGTDRPVELVVGIRDHARERERERERVSKSNPKEDQVSFNLPRLVEYTFNRLL